MTTEKVAVTVERELLATVERLREKSGESRSAVFGRAIRKLVESQQRDHKVRRYVAAYREQPETRTEIQMAEALARESWKHAPEFLEKGSKQRKKRRR